MAPRVFQHCAFASCLDMWPISSWLVIRGTEQKSNKKTSYEAIYTSREKKKKIISLGPKAASECPEAENYYNICQEHAMIQFSFKTSWKLGPKDLHLSNLVFGI